jgi:hypothetical protein
MVQHRDDEREPTTATFSFFFVSLGAEHSDLGRYVYPPSLLSLRITHLLQWFEGGHAYIMMQQRDDEREPAIATFFFFFFANWSLVAELMVKTMMASPRANAGSSSISDNCHMRL